MKSSFNPPIIFRKRTNSRSVFLEMFKALWGEQCHFSKYAINQLSFTTLQYILKSSFIIINHICSHQLQNSLSIIVSHPSIMCKHMYSICLRNTSLTLSYSPSNNTCNFSYTLTRLHHKWSLSQPSCYNTVEKTVEKSVPVSNQLSSKYPVLAQGSLTADTDAARIEWALKLLHLCLIRTTIAWSTLQCYLWTLGCEAC